MSELKLCPFCDSEADIGHINLSPQSDTAILNKTTVLYFVNCINEKLTGCGANNGGPSVGHLSKESATKAWNSRAIETELLEALESVHHYFTVNGITKKSANEMGRLLSRTINPALAKARGKQS